jgi:hypothetical protein
MNKIIAKKANTPSTLPIIAAVRDIRPSFTFSAEDWLPVLGDRDNDPDPDCGASLVVRRSGAAVVPPFVFVDEPTPDWVPFTIPLVDDTVSAVAELD